MSKYDDKIDDNNVICPYCEYEYQMEGCDINANDDHHVEECQQCEKKFYRADRIEYSFKTTPDCKLNGEEHDYQPVSLPRGDHPFCTVCGKCQPFSEIERQAPDEGASAED